MKPEESAALRAPFPPESIGKLPRGNVMLDYCGHAAVTNRLLEVDPEWSWEPVATNDEGEPLIVVRDAVCRMWIRLTVCGVTRLGVGSVLSSAFDVEKQLIGDAIRNAAMRFGVALSLWSKEELEGFGVAGPVLPAGTTASSESSSARESGDVPATPEFTVGESTLNLLQSRVSALVTDKVPVSDHRKRAGLPPLRAPLSDEQAAGWKKLLDELEQGLTRPFV